MSTYYTGKRAQRYNALWRIFSEKTLAETMAMIDVTALRSVPEQFGRLPQLLDVACGTGILLRRLLAPGGQLVVEDFARRECPFPWTAFAWLLHQIEGSPVHASLLPQLLFHALERHCINGHGDRARAHG